MHFVLATVRYNNNTWTTNVEFRKKYKLPCIYATPFCISSGIPYRMPMLVLEMNNETNRLLGVGLIVNRLDDSLKAQIHENRDYNRYMYSSKYHLSRRYLLSYRRDLVTALEERLFTGYGHSKRGAGITRFPRKLSISDDGVDFASELARLFSLKYKIENRQYIYTEPLKHGVGTSAI